MNATPESLNSLFGIDVQYKVPLYQRRYVWEKSDWSVLWDDILEQEKIDSFKNAKHFTGPIVTRLIKGQQKRFEVIDGQQRLITFQIIFCVIRDLCEPLEFSGSETEKTAKKHIENRETARRDFQNRDPNYEDPNKRLPDPTYKLRTSEYDQTSFDAIIEELYGKKINETLKKNDNYPEEDRLKEARSQQFGEETVNDNILDAYDYFYKKIRHYIEKGPEEKPDKEKKIFNFLETIKSNFELVQITPGDSQQAEEIFESVNATGRKLSEFDYLRNNLFLRAGDQSDEFYRNYWIFENDPDNYTWSEDKLESFFQAFLIAKLGPDILKNDAKLFDVYEQNLKEENVENEFEELEVYAKTYKHLDNDNRKAHFKEQMQFYTDLSIFYDNKNDYNPGIRLLNYNNIILVQAFILHLVHKKGISHQKGQANLEQEELKQVFRVLESYTTRRLLIDTVIGSYAYQRIITYFRQISSGDLSNSEFSISELVKNLGVESQRRWIPNNVIKNLFQKSRVRYIETYSPYFQAGLRFTERYIFYRIENWMRKNDGKELLNFDRFPSILERIKYGKDLNHYRRNSLGNTTFCKRGRGKNLISFENEKEYLKKESGELLLNQIIYECSSEWGKDQITIRENRLLEGFYAIWPSKESLDGKSIIDLSKPKVVVKPEIVPQQVSTIQSNFAKSNKIGSIVRGKITNLTDFGAFAELPEGIEGLIHISELADRRIEKPEDIVSIGEELNLKVIKIDTEKRQIDLSLRAVMQPDLWIRAAEKYKVGSVVQGKIVSLANFGAFAELPEGIEGLIHISELADRRIEKPEDIVSIGEELNLKVIKIDTEKRQIDLSLRAVMQPDLWIRAAEKYKVGSVVQGKIVSLANFGAFAELPEGIEGLIHISELADRRIEKPEDIVSIGEELNLKVIKIDTEKRQIDLSLKALMESTLLETRLNEVMKTKNTNKSKN